LTLDPSAVAARKARGNESEQLALLAKYNSRIANISAPYANALGYGLAGAGVATNRKGPSERANMKDKSDRATNEQVLDPRTRIILFKMINRGLIEEVNGCVSTGKEVRWHQNCWQIIVLYFAGISFRNILSIGKCISRAYTRKTASRSQDL
jgi:RIO kinase 1